MRGKEVKIVSCAFCGAEAEIFYYKGIPSIKCQNKKCMAHYQSTKTLNLKKRKENEVSR